jgi:hypothetical protein
MSMLDDKSNMVPLLQSELIRESDKAYLVRWKENDQQFEQWLPKSKTRINALKQYCVPQWLYDKSKESL